MWSWAEAFVPAGTIAKRIFVSAPFSNVCQVVLASPSLFLACQKNLKIKNISLNARHTSTILIMSTVAELQNLTYRELQAECKAQGISAKGYATYHWIFLYDVRRVCSATLLVARSIIIWSEFLNCLFSVFFFTAKPKSFLENSSSTSKRRIPTKHLPLLQQRNQLHGNQQQHQEAHPPAPLAKA